jgi:hypothetical protein
VGHPTLRPGLARHLTAADQHVQEIDSGKHAGKRRNGKSDAIDGVRAARKLLARPAPAQMRADGDREALRLLMCDRDNAVASAKTARTLLTSVIVTAPALVRERLRHLPRDRRATVCAALTSPPGASRQTRVLHETLARLGQRVTALAHTAAGLEKQITVLAGETTPGLVAAETGLGARPGGDRMEVRHDHAQFLRIQRPPCADAGNPVETPRQRMPPTTPSKSSVCCGDEGLALGALVAFYGVNGRRLTLTNDAAYELIMQVAAGELDSVDEIAAILEKTTDLRP